MRVPGEVCTICLERGNHHRKVMLNVQKSAEAIVVKGNVVPFEAKGRISRSLKYDWERRDD